ncbi:hypothetical protein D3C76_1647870 [compost metagenome]
MAGSFDIYVLGVRYQLQQLLCTFLANYFALLATYEQGWDVHATGRILHSCKQFAHGGSGVVVLELRVPVPVIAAIVIEPPVFQKALG